MDSLDCDDLDFTNQWDLPTLRRAPDPDWAQHAACAGHPIELWFPNDGGVTLEARAICSTCPVQPQCLEHAVRVNEPHGTWGGRSERARARMRRSTRGAA